MPSLVGASPSNSPPQHHDDDDDDDEDDEQELPLQGTRDSAWDYLYEAKGGYLLAGQPSRRPTYEDTVIMQSKKPRQHKKSASLDLVSRLKGEGVQEMERRHRKKQSWSGSGLKMEFARFGACKGVKEIK
jgi:hypothetical protein